MDIELFKKDITNIYNELFENNVVRKLGIVNHDIFQTRLFELGAKYNLEVKTEYCGVSFFDEDLQRRKRGRIDLVYYQDEVPLIALEIDSGLKKSSVKKLVANKNFKYRIWFCYKKKMDMKKYLDLIQANDKQNELIYLLPEKEAKKRKRHFEKV